MIRSVVVPRLALLALLVLVSVRPVGAQCADCVFPGAEWDRVRGAALGDYGWDAERLRAVRDFLRDSANSTGVVVADRGRVVFEFGDVADLSYLASVQIGRAHV